MEQDIQKIYSPDRRETLKADYFIRIDSALKDLERLISKWTQANEESKDSNSSAAANNSQDDVDPLGRDMLQQCKRLRELHDKFRPLQASVQQSDHADERQEQRSRTSVRSDQPGRNERERHQDTRSKAKAPRATRERSQRDDVYDYIYGVTRDQHHRSRRDSYQNHRSEQRHHSGREPTRRDRRHGGQRHSTGFFKTLFRDMAHNAFLVLNCFDQALAEMHNSRN